MVCRAEVKLESLSVEMRVGCACRASVWPRGHSWCMSVRGDTFTWRTGRGSGRARAALGTLAFWSSACPLHCTTSGVAVCVCVCGV